MPHSKFEVEGDVPNPFDNAIQLMRRFRPYLKYLRAVRWPLYGALFFAAVYGVTGGLGLSYIIKDVLPRLFEPGAIPLTFVQIAGYAALIPAVFLVRGIAAKAGNVDVWFDESLVKGDWQKRFRTMPRVLITSHETDQ